MVGTDFMCLVSSHQESYEPCDFMFQQLDLPCAPLLPLWGIRSIIEPEKLGPPDKKIKCDIYGTVLSYFLLWHI